MKKTNRMISLFLAAFMLTASLASCDWGAHPVPEDGNSSAVENFTPHKFGVEDATVNGVRIGMTENQVTEILGDPDDRQNVTNDNFTNVYFFEFSVTNYLGGFLRLFFSFTSICLISHLNRFVSILFQRKTK